MFNNIHNTYLRIFYFCFSKKIIPVKEKETTWITRGIMVSINHKLELYLTVNAVMIVDSKTFTNYTVTF
jgi:hypothetical protein